MTDFTASSKHYYSNVGIFLFLLKFLFGEHTEKQVSVHMALYFSKINLYPNIILCV